MTSTGGDEGASEGPEIRFTTPERIYVIWNASRLLAIGSALLLVGVMMLWFGLFGLPFFLAFTMIGMALHLLAWVSLRESAGDSSLTLGIFVASIIAFVGGIGVVATISYGADEPQEFLFWLLFGGYATLPYWAPVYGPVAFAHALIFLIARGRLRSRNAAAMQAIGAVILAVIAIVALSLYVMNPRASGSSFLFTIPPSGILSGATALGYAFVALGWLREYDSAITRGPSRWFLPRRRQSQPPDE